MKTYLPSKDGLSRLQLRLDQVDERDKKESRALLATGLTLFFIFLGINFFQNSLRETSNMPAWEVSKDGAITFHPHMHSNSSLYKVGHFKNTEYYWIFQ